MAKTHEESVEEIGNIFFDCFTNKGRKWSEVKVDIKNVILEAEERGEERTKPSKSTALGKVFNWLKQYPKGTQIIITRIDPDCVIMYKTKEE